MKKIKKSVISVVILSVFNFSNLFCQITVEWGPEMKGTGDDEREQSYLLGSDGNDGYYSLREKVKSLNFNAIPVKRYIEHFDKDGNLIGSEKFKLDSKGGDRRFDGVFYRANHRCRLGFSDVEHAGDEIDTPGLTKFQLTDRMIDFCDRLFRTGN